VAESATLAGELLWAPKIWASKMGASKMGAPNMGASEDRGPLHCGAPMEWRSPEQGAMSSYSFETADRSLALPALWRCPCGFQLDGVESGMETGVERGVDQGAAGLVAALWQGRSLFTAAPAPVPSAPRCEPGGHQRGGGGHVHPVRGSAKQP
jgi:hypothetical protein